MTEYFCSSYNVHVSISTSIPECCYNWDQGAVFVWVVSRRWLPQVNDGYEISVKPCPKIWHHMHMKLAGASIVVFLIIHNFPRHVYFVSGTQCYCHLLSRYGCRDGIQWYAAYHPKTGRGQMTSASQTSCVRVVMAQVFFRNVDFICQWNTLSISFVRTRTSYMMDSRIHKFCPFE